MLRKYLAIALAASATTLCSGTAWADDDDDDDRQAGESEGKQDDAQPTINVDDTGRNIRTFTADKPGSANRKKKNWVVGGIFETHRLIRQNDLGGAARNKQVNYLYLYAGYSITPKDRVQVRGGIYQRFLADPGESGVRMDDVSFVYTRIVPLPWELTARVNGSMVVPLSFESQLMGLIVNPIVSGQLDRRFGNLSVGYRLQAAGWVTKYKSAPGGDTLPYLTVSNVLNAEYAMPFHDPLSVGVSVSTSFTFNNDPTNGDDPNAARYGVVNDPQFGTSQPVQQRYGGQLYARYVMPEFNDIKSDISITLANGDPTLGYTGVVHDGRQHLYGLWRQSAQVYASLGVRY